MQQYVGPSDELELKFHELSQAQLKKFQGESSQAQVRAETELTCVSIISKFQILVKNYNKISQFCSYTIILINFMIIYLNLLAQKVNLVDLAA